MKKILLFLCLAAPFYLKAQVIADTYKAINIGDNGVGDATHNLILIHEMYNGTNLEMNYAVGTITAFRGAGGAFNRINVVQINSSSAYTNTAAGINSLDDMGVWKLKTCIYNGKKYLALDVPYHPAYHNVGYKFVGWTVSTGANMLSVAYQVQNAPVNQSVLSDIQDFVPNLNESHMVNNFNVMGNVGIGTLSPTEKLSVNGNIRAKEVKVETVNWPDYVFAPNYQNASLAELEKYIQTYRHLPEIPSAAELEQNGVLLGEMNKLLLKKIEELTLHLIEQDKTNAQQQAQINKILKIK